jgi:hypothetical protein
MVFLLLVSASLDAINCFIFSFFFLISEIVAFPTPYSFESAVTVCPSSSFCKMLYFCNRVRVRCFLCKYHKFAIDTI